MSFPKINSIKRIDDESETNESSIRDTNDDEKMKLIKSELMCSIYTKYNYSEQNKYSYGYLIIQKEDNVKNKNEIYPIPELICEKAYELQAQNQKSKMEYYYFNLKDKINNNNYINYWFPVYIREEHYIKNKKEIINTLKKINNDDTMSDADLIFNIIPLILNKIINGMLNKKNDISTAFTKCYFHFLLLFKKLINEFQEDLIKYLNHKLNLIYNNDYNVEKEIIPNIENFIILLLICNRNVNNEKMDDMWYYIYEEYITRQIYWMFNNKGYVKDILKKVKLSNKFKNTNKVLNTEDKTLKECLRTGNCVIKIKDNKNFINELKENEIYDEVIECFLHGIYDKKYLKEKTDLKLKESFQNTFNNSSVNIRKKIINKLINIDEEYYEYFKLSNDGNKIYEEEFTYKPLILKYKIQQILFNKECKEYSDELEEIAYKSQRINNTLIIICYMDKIIKEKGFYEELEQNYGIYLNVNNLIKEIKKKVNEVESYAQMLEYVKSPYGKDQTDIEIIRNAYNNAKWKKYI